MSKEKKTTKTETTTEDDEEVVIIDVKEEPELTVEDTWRRTRNRGEIARGGVQRTFGHRGHDAPLSCGCSRAW